MINIDIEEQKLEAAFADEAAQEFALNPHWWTWSRSHPPKQGELLALRWGMGADGVLVVRLDENFEPRNYMSLIAKAQ